MIKKKNKTRIILLIILCFFTAIFLHNAWFYPPLRGYDGGIHSTYTKIITFEKRIPTPKDTPESYNPPAFYFLSGKLAKLFTPSFNNDFFQALKSWQILIALLMPVVGYLWFDIYRTLNRKNKYFPLFFLFWLLSLPVVNKMAPMYNIEAPQLIISSFIIWFFIKFVLPKPTISKIILLGFFGGIMLLFRIMAGTLLLSLALMIILLFWCHKISFKKMIILNLVLTVVSLGIGGQYYYIYRNQGVFDSGENVQDLYQTPFLKRQPKSFYVDTFFRTMMKTPIRPNFINRFIPIFYSSFWGDYWNFYRQRRYPLSLEEEIKFKETAIPTAPNRYQISKERLTMLAWQNRINFIPTLILITGMILSIWETVKKIKKRRFLNLPQFSEVFLSLFFVITFLAYFYTVIQFPNIYKGDNIKASYILYATPSLIYFGCKLLQSIKKIKYLFPRLIIIVIIISFIFNLNFNIF